MGRVIGSSFPAISSRDRSRALVSWASTTSAATSCQSSESLKQRVQTEWFGEVSIGLCLLHQLLALMRIGHQQQDRHRATRTPERCRDLNPRPLVQRESEHNQVVLTGKADPNGLLAVRHAINRVPSIAQTLHDEPRDAGVLDDQNPHLARLRDRE